MIWLTWRQFRVQAVSAAAILGAFAILLAITGPHLASEYASSGVPGCRGGNCEQLASNFLSQVKTGVYPFVYTLGLFGIVLVPAIIGIFWGAPLIARELETGTFRLVWTQTVTRNRWLGAKLAVTGLTAVGVTEVLSLIHAWWAAPIDQAARFPNPSNLGVGPFSTLTFDAHGITPLGYAAFAFALGVTTGVVFRRTVPAMAVALGVFAVVQIAFPLWVRPNLFPASHTTVSIASATQNATEASIRVSKNTFRVTMDDIPQQPGAWIISSEAVNAAGHPVQTIPAACLNSQNAFNCMADQGYGIALSYEPTSRYWSMQEAETGIYLGLALALSGYCFWRLGRRLS
jgi:hypothetical protein